MPSIPRAARLLGSAGLLPFFWGAWLTIGKGPAVFENFLPQALLTDGPYLLISYGSIILSFMSGCLWGFATQAKSKDQIWAFGLSVLPALYVFFALVGPGPAQLTRLIIGFTALLALDGLYQRAGLAPSWWLRLRVGITIFVVLALILARQFA